VTTVDYPGSSFSQVNGITDTGTIVGHFVDSGGVFHGYVLKDGIYNQIDFPGALDTLPFYMNYQAILPANGIRTQINSDTPSSEQARTNGSASTRQAQQPTALSPLVSMIMVMYLGSFATQAARDTLSSPIKQT
jgi:hypothetical protein